MRAAGKKALRRRKRKIKKYLDRSGLCAYHMERLFC